MVYICLRDPTAEVQPQIHIHHSLIQHCVGIVQALMSLLGAQLHMTRKLTYLMTAHYTPKDGFTANDALFYKSEVV